MINGASALVASSAATFSTLTFGDALEVGKSQCKLTITMGSEKPETTMLALGFSSKNVRVGCTYSQWVLSEAGTHMQSVQHKLTYFQDDLR